MSFCDHCGTPIDATDANVDADPHRGCRAARVMEPPRYCRECARRMVVQVTPRGWSARCGRHGIVTSGGG